MSEDRRAQLAGAVRAYFDGLNRKDISNVPWSESVILRAPLAEGGSENPLVGRTAVLAYLEAVLPALGEVRLVDWYSNESLTAVVGKADISLANGRTLRVADLFEIDELGQIVAQENHYDPRPAGADPQTPTADDLRKIDEATQTAMKAAVAGDFGSWAALFLDDAVVYPPNETAVEGQEAIRAWLEKLPQLKDFKLTNVKVDGRADLAYVLGTYTMTMAIPAGPAPVTDVGKFVSVLRRQANGRWLCAVDMFSSDLPSAPLAM